MQQAICILKTYTNRRPSAGLPRVSYSQQGSDTKRCGTPAHGTRVASVSNPESSLLETLNNLEQNIAELLLIIVGYKLRLHDPRGQSTASA